MTGGDQENISLKPVGLGSPWPGRKQAPRVGVRDRSQEEWEGPVPVLAAQWSPLGMGWDGWDELLVPEMQ